VVDDRNLLRRHPTLAARALDRQRAGLVRCGDRQALLIDRIVETGVSINMGGALDPSASGPAGLVLIADEYSDASIRHGLYQTEL
jgi:hypothetical protein